MLALLVHCCNERSQLALLLGLAVSGLSLTLTLAAPLLERDLGGHAREDAEGGQLLLNRQDRLLGVGGRHASALGDRHFSLFEMFGGHWKCRGRHHSILRIFFNSAASTIKSMFFSCCLGFVLVILSLQRQAWREGWVLVVGWCVSYSVLQRREGEEDPCSRA